MRTTLNLLTSNGAVYMDFQPALSPELYARLFDIAKRAATDDELRNSMAAFARAEGLRLSFDELREAVEG